VSLKKIHGGSGGGSAGGELEGRVLAKQKGNLGIESVKYGKHPK